MNKVILLGRLTKDPEVRYTQTGKCVATFQLAVDRKVPKDAPAGTPKADFIPVVAWNKLGELVSNYLSKGRQVLVEGRMQVRNYDAQDGSKRYVTEVIMDNMEFVGSKSDNAGQQGSNIANQNQQPPANYQQGTMFDGSPAPADDDIPF